MNIQIHQSPVGPLTLVSESGNLVGCYFENSPVAKRLSRNATRGANDTVLENARRQLDGFFSRRLERFSIPIAPRGTAFQQRVWEALRSIPFGETVSYGYISKHIGKPTASRAVGAANGQNPICIFVPCHRVIGADGSLTGFGGGIARKEFLLALEREGVGGHSLMA